MLGPPASVIAAKMQRPPEGPVSCADCDGPPYFWVPKKSGDLYGPRQALCARCFVLRARARAAEAPPREPHPVYGVEEGGVPA